MSHEEAIKLIMPHFKSEDKAEALAANYAMDDILFDGLDKWLSTPTYRLIEQFVSIGLEVLEDYMCEPFTDELKQRKFAEGAISISESMYYYALLHSKVLDLDGKKMSDI